MTVCMCKRMQSIVLIHAEVCTGNKDGSGCSKGNVTSSVTNCSCSDSCRCIITCSCNNFYIFRKSEFCCYFRLQTSYDFVTFIKFRKLFLLLRRRCPSFLWTSICVLHPSEACRMHPNNQSRSFLTGSMPDNLLEA